MVLSQMTYLIWNIRYEYDESGHITAATDQNGSRYLENEYDIKGRITRQNFPDSIY